MSPADLKQIGALFQERKPIVATKLMEFPTCGVERLSLTIILKDLREGKSPDEIARARKGGAASAGRPPVCSEENVATIRDMIQKDNSSKGSSHRRLTEVAGISEGSVRKISKAKLKVRSLKRVRATKTSAQNRGKREKVAKDLAQMFHNGLDVDAAWFTDET